MLTDKQLKKKYEQEFKKNPEKYYPTKILHELGFTRIQCAKCKRFFWSTDKKRTVCGDSSCMNGYTFLTNPISKAKLDYIQTWKKFAEILKKQGYTPINRYPVTARWRDDIHFVEASIDDFIPYVINGEVEPPANPLIVPQLCLRFNDIDNVGITGAHNTGFVMIGQHRFEKPENYKPNDYIFHLYKWFEDGLKISKDDLILHEDVWAGSGNFGPCVEFFSGGLEICNQVFMQFRQTNTGYENLKLKVLDMGLGQERSAWFSQGTPNLYESTFPTVIKKLNNITGLKPDHDILARFLPYSGMLNIDEIDNVEKVWSDIAKNIAVDTKQLKETVLPLAALYSIAEHSRSLLIALSDSALPSNVGGGYNLRVILRRALSFINHYNWDISIPELTKLHAKYLKPIFPELSKNLDLVQKILGVEEEKYKATKEKSKDIVTAALKKDITENRLVELYDSQGIPPEIIRDEAEKQGKQVNIPENFYARISELHEKKEKKEQKPYESINLKGLPETEILFYDNIEQTEFRAKVLKIINKKYVILDKTLFYPESGGQETDQGTFGTSDVYEVQKQDGIIIHFVKDPKFKEGEIVKGTINWERRKQLMQHHTAVHLINGAARKVLGDHVWQAGSGKTEEKAHLDITHYQSLTDEEIEKIEKLANDAVKKGINIEKPVLSRTEAEKKFGMRIYQGGAVPGNKLRIINIPHWDVEACGGTHLNNTKDVGKIIILGSERIQDGVDRITIKAGKAAQNYLEYSLRKANELLQHAKTIKFFKLTEKVLKLEPEQAFKQLQDCAKLFNVPINNVKSTFEKFHKEIGENNEQIRKIREYLEEPTPETRTVEINNLLEICDFIFKLWKEQGKYIDRMQRYVAKAKAETLIPKAKNNNIFEVVHAPRKELIEIAEHIIIEKPDMTVILVNESGDVIGMSRSRDISAIVKDICKGAGGSGGGNKELAQGKGDLSKILKILDKY